MGKRKLLFSHRKNYERQKYDRKRQLYNSLVKGSISLPQGWTNLNKEGEIALCKFNKCATTGCLEVTHSLQVSSDLTWQSCIHGHPVTRENCSLLSHLPSMLTSYAMFTTLIDIFETSKICQGNPDHRFIPLQKERQEIFKDASGSRTVAYVDSRTALTVKGEKFPETI